MTLPAVFIHIGAGCAGFTMWAASMLADDAIAWLWARIRRRSTLADRLRWRHEAVVAGLATLSEYEAEVDRLEAKVSAAKP